MQLAHEWLSGADAWKHFAQQHPELGYSSNRMAFYNFLRYHRDRLVETDAIRRAKRRFWVAHAERFGRVAFDCATGVGVEK